MCGRLYSIIYSRKAQKDISRLKAAGLDKRAKMLIDILRTNPWQNPPSYEKLLGELKYLYSRRINVQHRLIYEVLENEKTVKIVSLWSHYERL